MKVLVVQTGFIGDVILSLPVFGNLKKLYPDAEITALVAPAAAELVAAQEPIAHTLVYDKRGRDRGMKGFFSIRRCLKNKNFDLVFSLHKSWRSAALLWLSGIPQRYGFREASGYFLYTRTISRNPTPLVGSTHEVERNLKILQNFDLGNRALDTTLCLTLTEKSRERALELLRPIIAQGPIVGIAPGSVWRTKRWRTDGFLELAKSLLEAGCKVVLIGGKEDSAIGEIIESALLGKVLNLIGKTTLIEAAAVISKLSVLVTNDSAPIHLASALKISVVAIFCATVPAFGYGPWQTKSKIIGVSGLYCRPCGRHGPKSCPVGTYDCQRLISAKEVFDATYALLPSTARQAA